MFLNCSVLISCLLALLSPFLWAETSHFDEKIFEMEAQLETIKSELAQTKILAQQERASAFNPSISVIGDIVGQYGIGVPEEPKNGHAKDSHDHSHSHDFQNGVNVRELEFEFRGAIDPWADALVVVAIEQHGLKHFEIDVEEAFVRLKKWPVLDYAPLGIESRLGKFRTAIGRMNRIHLHNIPHISYPLALQVFLGEEGYASQGLSFNSSWVPSSKSALTWFLEGITGSRLPMQDKGAQEVPSGIGHLWWHQELNDAHFIDLGISSLVGRKGKYESGTFWLSGADFHYSYLPTGHGQNPVFLFGSEFYMANKETDKGWPLGNFTWAQVKMLGSSFFGMRYDIAPHKDDFSEMQHAIGIYTGVYTTEFMRVRLGYEHVMPRLNSLDGDHRFLLSFNFILGSHPVEPYFANR